MDIKCICKSKKMTDFNYGVYKSFNFISPKELTLTLNDKVGTYIAKHIKNENGSDISYRIYHCKNINDKIVWYKLPSIRVTDGVISADKDSIEALNAIIDDLPEELVELLNGLNNYLK